MYKSYLHLDFSGINAEHPIFHGPSIAMPYTTISSILKLLKLISNYQIENAFLAINPYLCKKNNRSYIATQVFLSHSR